MTSSLKRQAAVQRSVEDQQRGYASFFDIITQDTPLVAMLRRNAERVRQQENEL